MRNRLLIIVLLFIVFTLNITGCTNKDRSAKEQLLELSGKAPIIRSYTFNQTIDLSFEIQGKNKTSERLATLEMIPEFHIELEGQQNNEPRQAEGQVKTKTIINGREFTYDTPYYLNNNNFYIQLPSMLTNFMPNSAKKYLFVDLTNRIIGNQVFKNDLLILQRELIKRFNDGAFERKNDDDIVFLNGQVSDIISINITQENLNEFLNTVSVEEIIELLNMTSKYINSEKDRGILNNWVTHIINNKNSIVNYLENIDKYIKIDTLEVIVFYDNEGFLRRTAIDFNILWYTEKAETIEVKGNILKDINNINEEIILEKVLPSKDEIIDFKDLNQMQNILL